MKSVRKKIFLELSGCQFYVDDVKSFNDRKYITEYTLRYRSSIKFIYHFLWFHYKNDFIKIYLQQQKRKCVQMGWPQQKYPFSSEKTFSFQMNKSICIHQQQNKLNISSFFQVNSLLIFHFTYLDSIFTFNRKQAICIFFLYFL